ncbi:hypothetical protein EDB81DRAFT_939873 [Dactylonectria macrodidyma]|uniref:Uncharacterized protein n=1 Tax=Dactylonectria macrodidyma TaxID=307937 RepID=A0A9P9FT44_9HYPO|nr:hypothetical protein EDB81DRAFT_939873 [Dactylonectria macrodidyma]
MTLPFYAFSTIDAPDIRTIPQHEGKGSVLLRNRDELAFLSPSHYLNADSSPQAQAYLHDTVCSIMITGQDDNYWTCFCFNEDSFEERDQQRLQTEDDTEQDGGAGDPITGTEETVASIFPRTYGLQALVSFLKTICEHQCMLQERFEESLTFFTKDLLQLRIKEIGPKEIHKWGKAFRSTSAQITARNTNILDKLKVFLDVEVGLDADAIPRGRLFQSLQDDPIAMRLLREIDDIRKDILEANQELIRYKETCDEFRRERKTDQFEEGHSLANEAQKLQQLLKAIAALQIVLSILTLAAQLFSAWGVSSRVGFIILVLFIVVICIISSVVFFWMLWKGRLVQLFQKVRYGHQ